MWIAWELEPLLPREVKGVVQTGDDVGVDGLRAPAEVDGRACLEAAGRTGIIGDADVSDRRVPAEVDDWWAAAGRRIGIIGDSGVSGLRAAAEVDGRFKAAGPVGILGDVGAAAARLALQFALHAVGRFSWRGALSRFGFTVLAPVAGALGTRISIPWLGKASVRGLLRRG